jgi:hypothetical protein
MAHGDSGVETDHLDPRARKIAKVIVAAAKKSLRTAVNTGGCRAFYTPQEWRDRGEEYGDQSLLIVVHDGGDLARFFNYDYGDYAAVGAMEAALREAGYYAESCMAWYTAIYKWPV